MVRQNTQTRVLALRPSKNKSHAGAVRILQPARETDSVLAAFSGASKTGRRCTNNKNMLHAASPLPFSLRKDYHRHVFLSIKRFVNKALAHRKEPPTGGSTDHFRAILLRRRSYRQYLLHGADCLPSSHSFPVHSCYYMHRRGRNVLLLRPVSLPRQKISVLIKNLFAVGQQVIRVAQNAAAVILHAVHGLFEGNTAAQQLV